MPFTDPRILILVSAAVLFIIFVIIVRKKGGIHQLLDQHEPPNGMLDHYVIPLPLEQLKNFETVMSKQPIDRIAAKRALMEV
jgi:hypothetical protein